MNNFGESGRYTSHTLPKHWKVRFRPGNISETETSKHRFAYRPRKRWTRPLMRSPRGSVACCLDSLGNHERSSFCSEAVCFNVLVIWKILEVGWIDEGGTWRKERFRIRFGHWCSSPKNQSKRQSKKKGIETTFFQFIRSYLKYHISGDSKSKEPIAYEGCQGWWPEAPFLGSWSHWKSPCRGAGIWYHSCCDIGYLKNNFSLEWMLVAFWADFMFDVYHCLISHVTWLLGFLHMGSNWWVVWLAGSTNT